MGEHEPLVGLSDLRVSGELLQLKNAVVVFHLLVSPIYDKVECIKEIIRE